MSRSQVVSIQLGQCGNQVGGEMYNTFINEAIDAKGLRGVKSDYYHEITNNLFRQPRSEKEGDLPIARAVLIDMEPKAIVQTVHMAQKSGKWVYAQNSSLWKQSGSGNNWAYGYAVHGKMCEEDMLNIVRKEIEHTDVLGGLLLIQSLAGGTGSGLGTYLTEILRDEISHVPILNHTVWPYSEGEVAVQNYNSILTLSHLYQVSDAIFVIENDTIGQVCTKLLKIKKANFLDMNKVIAHNLAGLLLPSKKINEPKTNESDFSLFYDLISHLCPHPSYKLLSMKTIPQTPLSSIEFNTFTWPMLTKHLHQMLITDSKLDVGINWHVKWDDIIANDESMGIGKQPLFQNRRSDICKSIANMLVLRGEGSNSVDTSIYSHSLLYPKWLPSTERFLLSTNPKNFNKHEKSGVLLSNSQSIINPLERILEKGYSMLTSNAYLHQYEEHGILRDHFMMSFTQLESVSQNYKNM